MKYEKRKEEKALRTPRFLISIFHSHYHREALGMVVKDIIENYPLKTVGNHPPPLGFMRLNGGG